MAGPGGCCGGQWDGMAGTWVILSPHAIFRRSKWGSMSSSLPFRHPIRLYVRICTTHRPFYRHIAENAFI